MRYGLIVLLMLLLPGMVQAKVKVIDGDSIVVDGVERRLSGIDAPEYNQICFDAKSKEYQCGQMAMSYLKKLVNNKIKCKTLTTDRYKRKVSECKVGNLNINEEMVRQGMAVSYNQYEQGYDKAEKQAKDAKLGIWQGRFIKPELFRSLSR